MASCAGGKGRPRIERAEPSLAVEGVLRLRAEFMAPIPAGKPDVLFTGSGRGPLLLRLRACVRVWAAVRGIDGASAASDSASSGKAGILMSSKLACGRVLIGELYARPPVVGRSLDLATRMESRMEDR